MYIKTLKERNDKSQKRKEALGFFERKTFYRQFNINFSISLQIFINSLTFLKGNNYDFQINTKNANVLLKNISVF